MPFAAIVVCQLLAETPNLNADCRVVARIVGGGLAESVDGDDVFFQIVCFTRCGFFSKKPQQPAQHF